MLSGASPMHVLVRIHEPKTRGRAARHQSAKLEPADLVQLCSLAFEHQPRSSRIWPMSAQTLRRRLYLVLDRLGMPRSGGRERPLDLGSLRPGGATYLLQQTEDSELVRRRGRWISHKIMEIYLQEVSASTFVADLDPACRDKVLTASAGRRPSERVVFPLASSLSWCTWCKSFHGALGPLEFSFFFAGGCQFPYGTAPGHSSMEVKSAELELLIYRVLYT